MHRPIAVTVVSSLLTLVPAAAQSAARFVAVLSPATVVPPCTTLAGSGTAIAYLHEPGHVLLYDIEATGLLAPSMAWLARLRAGAPGVAGSTLATLPDPLVTGSSGHWCGRLVLSAAEATALAGGQLFFDVVTFACISGQLRGQLVPNEPGAFVANLDGAQVVPGGSGSPARGHSSLQLNPNGTLAYLVRSTLNGTAAYFRLGAAGVAGAPIPGLTLPLSMSGPGTWIGNTPVPLTTSQLSTLRGGQWHVVILSTSFPSGDGEIRGQLLNARRPVPVGSGCPGASGAPAETAAQTVPAIGNAYRLELFGASPATPAILFHGALPATLPYGGSCVFRLDPSALLVTIPTGTNAIGCAEYNLPIPYDHSLLGLRLISQWLLFDFAAPFPYPSSNALATTVQ